jgi:hypothetical protein
MRTKRDLDQTAPPAGSGTCRKHEAFVAWARMKFYEHQLTRDDCGAEIVYADPEVQGAWLGWCGGYEHCKAGMQEQWLLCGHPAWPDPLAIQPSTGASALRFLRENYHPSAWLVCTVTGHRRELRGEELRACLDRPRTESLRSLQVLRSG